VLRALAPRDIPRIEAAHIDGRALAFALLVTLATALVFSMAPLVAMLRTSPAVIMRASSSRLTRQRGTLERGGVFVQAALVVVLLTAAALLLRTHRELTAVDPGFRASSLLSVRLRFLPPVTRYRDPASRHAVLAAVAARVDALPGVEAATPAFAVPFQGVSSTSIHVGGSRVVAPTEEIAGTYIVAAPGFFETMGIALRAGRLFEPVDDAPGSAIMISETMARRFWPNASAIGRQVLVDDVWRDVIGVVADVRHRTVDEDPRATFYLPAAQSGQRLMDAVVLRSSGDPRDQLAAVRRIITETDPSLAIARADRLSDLVDATLVAERFRMALLGVFAVAAVILAAIGIVGVATNAVSRRKRELAIRLAVGAAPSSVVRLVMSGTISAALGGAAVGITIALAITRLLRPFLFGVSNADPVTYVTVSLLLVTIAALAAWIPARRSMRIDLMRTLSTD
jgi:putative ABC transport system permease protein